MESIVGENLRDRSRRPVRNKRNSRKGCIEEKRPQKRLFTPEIKRFLKSWLIRRRDNPYPNRDEKKLLAVHTGLTYIQVCNWFANWRRKLKNAGKEPQPKTWGDLIKTYNDQVQGNVEHFSICSDDSIWEDSEKNYDYCSEAYETSTEYLSTPKLYQNEQYFNNNMNEVQNQCYYISSTTEPEPDLNPFSQSSNKYKSQIIEKYLKDCQKPDNQFDKNLVEENKPSMISKWLESAANFKPSENNYIEWSCPKQSKKKVKKTVESIENLLLIHGREELDAAEALTTLANSRFKI